MKLKNILIVGLFSLLLVPCFSSAWFTRQYDLLTTVRTVWWNSTLINTSSYFRVNSNWTLYTSYLWISRPVFYTFYNQSWQKRFWLFYRDKNWLPYLYSYAYYNSSNIVDIQWNFVKYSLCNVISSVPSDSSWNDKPWGCTTYDVSGWFNSLLNTFFSSVSPSDKYYYRTNYWVSTNSYVESNFTLCFSSVSFWNSICFDWNFRNWPNIWSYTNTQLINSVWYDSSLDFATLDIEENNPWGSGLPFNPPAYLWDWYTNQDVMLSWSREWYTKDLCYSNFPISQLFDMSSSYTQIFDDYLEDWMWYWTGATIIDLYDEFNLIDFGSFFSQFIWNTRLMLKDWVIPSYFSWKSVWLWNVWFRLVQHMELWSNFNAIDYEQFCRFALNLSWNAWDWDYTWPELPSNVENHLDNEKWIRICSMTWAESSAFCGAFSAWGWGWGWGSRPAGISDFYNKWFSILESLEWVSGSEYWILPNYIIVAFLGFVLLYMLKR